MMNKPLQNCYTNLPLQDKNKQEKWQKENMPQTPLYLPLKLNSVYKLRYEFEEEVMLL